MLDQSSADASSVVSIWALSMGRAASSSKSPPLNHSTVSKPDPAPDGHCPEQVACQRAELLGSALRVFKHARKH